MVSRFTYWLVALNATVPAILLAWDAANGRLGANPVNFAIRTTGLLSLIFLALSLAVTPVVRLSGRGEFGVFRRLTGLYAFFHAAIHFALFAVLDRGSVGETLSEIVSRTYLLVGTVGLVIMLPLAVTSTNGMIRRLGPRNWKRLHQFAYVAALAGALHFFLLVKSDTTRPLIYFGLLAGLFAFRLGDHYRSLRRELRTLRTATPAATPGLPRPWTGPLRLVATFEETPHVRTFRFASPDGGELPFRAKPGQYLVLTVEIDGKRVRRSYTIASPPGRSGYCELTVKREETGLVSRHLHDTLNVGDTVTVTAPAGSFTFTGTESERLMMIAGGVGITPLMATLRELTDRAWPGEVHLLVSVRNEADVIFRAELEHLRDRHPNFRLFVTATRAVSESWPYERGRIDEARLARALAELPGCRVHLCGPTEMTSPLIATLHKLGVPPDRVHSESFASPSRGGTGATAAESPIPDLPTGPATLRFDRTGTVVPAGDGRTILELAEANGVKIPFECRAGVCGRCKVRVTAGSVVMDSEDALTSGEKADGLILSCQARCVGEVVLMA